MVFSQAKTAALKAAVSFLYDVSSPEDLRLFELNCSADFFELSLDVVCFFLLNVLFDV
jgi:hypothetical protein